MSALERKINSLEEKCCNLGKAGKQRPRKNQRLKGTKKKTLYTVRVSKALHQTKREGVTKRLRSRSQVKGEAERSHKNAKHRDKL